MALPIDLNSDVQLIYDFGRDPRESVAARDFFVLKVSLRFDEHMLGMRSIGNRGALKAKDAS